jgi:hypothetical protein
MMIFLGTSDVWVADELKNASATWEEITAIVTPAKAQRGRT